MYQFSREVREAYERLNIALAVYQVIDSRVVTVLVSDGMCRARKDTREHLIHALDSSMFERVHPEDAGKLAVLGQEFARHERPYDSVFRASDEEGNIRLIHAVGNWQTMPDGTELAFCYYLDLSDSEEIIQESSRSYLEQQKEYFFADWLTGLPNLNYYQKFGQEKVRAIRLRGQQPVLLYYDLFALQDYNNQYGYEAGSELLKMTAKILRENYPDALVIRGSDDHFFVLAGNEHSEETIRRVHDQVIINSQGNIAGVKVSVCVLEETDTAFSAMDHVLHAFKTIGSDVNSYIAYYTPSLDIAYFKQRHLINTFENDADKEFIHVHYQRIVDNAHENVVYGETLSRWIDPNEGIISPGQFIPALRKHHLLYQLDLRMVEQICREYAERKRAGLPLVPVSVNLSAQDFDHVDMHREIINLLEKYEVPVAKVIIEITEEDVAKAGERFREQMNDFIASGFTIWVDDFGTGYSSLNVFTRFHFDLIKIDQSLISRLDKDRGANKVLIRAIVETAHQLGIRTLCEGVETREQFEFVKDVSCDFTQGFYFFKPEPLDAIVQSSQGPCMIRPLEEEL